MIHRCIDNAVVIFLAYISLVVNVFGLFFYFKGDLNGVLILHVTFIFYYAFGFIITLRYIYIPSISQEFICSTVQTALCQHISAQCFVVFMSSYVLLALILIVLIMCYLLVIMVFKMCFQYVCFNWLAALVALVWSEMRGINFVK